MACVYHAAAAHLARIDRDFGAGDLTLSQRPLFPNALGQTPSKAAVVLGIEGLANAIGVGTLDDFGEKRFGGHSMRVSGAQWLAAIGLAVPLIRSLARWESDTVLRYIRDAHLSGLTDSVVRILR